MSEEKKCSRCKKIKPINEFSFGWDNKHKNGCNKCLEQLKKSRDKLKCKHGKQKSKCLECGGSSLCEHKKEKYRCKICNGASICEHNNMKSSCKTCGGTAICIHNKHKIMCKLCNDPIKITIKNWIRKSTQSDKEKNRYTEETKSNFIDFQYCSELIDLYKHCYHCSISLQYINYQNDLATIERLDNTLGHTKKNCVVACMKCNKQLGNKYKNDLLKKYKEVNEEAISNKIKVNCPHCNKEYSKSSLTRHIKNSCKMANK